MLSLQEENKSFNSELELLRVHMKEKEEKFQMDLSSTQKQLDCERVAHNETRLRWEACRNRLEEEKKQHSIEQTRVSNLLYFRQNSYCKN